MGKKPAAAVLSRPSVSPELQEFVRILNIWSENREFTDREIRKISADFEAARDRLLAIPVSSLKQLGELAVCWRIEQWRTMSEGDDLPTAEATALWHALQEISGVSVKEHKGLWTLVAEPGQNHS